MRMIETKVAPVLCVQGCFQAVVGECRICIVSETWYVLFFLFLRLRNRLSYDPVIYKYHLLFVSVSFHTDKDKSNFNNDFYWTPPKQMIIMIMILSKLSMNAYLQIPAINMLFSRFWQQNSLIIDFNNNRPSRIQKYEFWIQGQILIDYWS